MGSAGQGEPDAGSGVAAIDPLCGLFETLLGPEDAILSDALNHASIIDGVRLSKPKRFRYANNDMAELEKCLIEAQDCRFRLIATDGSRIRVIWDIASCTAADYDLLWGSLGNVSAYTLDNASCNLGTSGMINWTGVPLSDLYFMVVSDDGSGSEGSWGVDSNGIDRNGASASNFCGNASRENAGTCPASP